MPYVLTAGFFAFALTGLGLASLRSHDDHAVAARLGDMERTLDDLRESNDYLTQMLEAALLPDEERPRPKYPGAGRPRLKPLPY